ncbi:myosin-2 heavy chain, non muscle-like [Myripristis murdjan]|uniref:myosin-2 heavy chain, non muscle-like n=1 Tax=Myripristis murdjan TaxID=586833 RepID=UPI001175D7BF|nr:myosin-2 heavy chain, non muscle-like [Myripristis murdjan]
MKQKELDLKDEDIKRQAQDLQKSRDTMLAEREELELFRKDLHQKKEDIEATLEGIDGEKEYLKQIKADIDRDREMLGDEKDRLEIDWSNLRMREEELFTKLTATENLRAKLKQLNDRSREDIRTKMDRLQQKNEAIEKLCTTLKEKHVQLDEEKEKMDAYVEMIGREKERLMRMRSNMRIQHQVTENEVNKKLLMEKHKDDLGIKRQDTRKIQDDLQLQQNDFGLVIGKTKREEGRGVEEMVLQTKKKIDEFEPEPVMKTVDDQSTEMKARKQTQIKNVVELLQNLKTKKEDIDQKTLQLETQITKDKIEEKDNMLRPTELETGDIYTHRLEKDSPQYTDKDLEQMAIPGQDDFTEDDISEIDHLRKIWKETKTERKEIDQIKRRGHEMKKNLEKRLKLINDFVRKTWVQRDKEPLQKMDVVLEQGHLTHESHRETDRKMLHDKYRELELLKVQMLRQIEKLNFKEKVATTEKAMQTLEVDVTTQGVILQLTEEQTDRTAKKSQVTCQEQGEQAEEQKIQESAAASGRSTGLALLRHYCYRCCCPCCDCCGQVCNEEA